MALRKTDLRSGGVARDRDGRTLTSNRTSSTPKKDKGKFKSKATSQEFRETNDDRLGLWVANPGTTDLYFSMGATAVVGEGWVVPKETKSMVQVFPGYTGRVDVIASAEEKEFPYAEL